MKIIRVRYLLLILSLVSFIAIITIWGAEKEQPIIGEQQAKGKSVQLTVYNQNLALVKDRRMLELSNGVTNYRFTDVASQIDPTSVKFYTPNITGIRVLEQNYEYDIVNDSKLLQKFLGEKIKVIDSKGELVEGYLLGTGENLVISSKESGGEVQIIKSSQIKSIVFPELPGGLVVRPTLVWLLQNANKTGKQLVEVSYLTRGLSWAVDYVATINQNDNKVDLTGWVTLNNQSGTGYENAYLKLIAGDVNQVKEEEVRVRKALISESAKFADTNSFNEESFFEYHMYSLNRSTTLKNNQIKQVELLTANTVPAKKLFIYEGTRDPKKVKTMLEFTNNSTNNMGMPLPKGRIRVQKADQSGSLQFIGEDRIDHTPKDEKVRIYLGNAFDIIGERVRTEVKESKNSRESSYRIVLRNHKKEAVIVTVVETMPYWNEWNITNSNHKYTKTESSKVEFAVSVPANGEQVITYIVRQKN